MEEKQFNKILQNIKTDTDAFLQLYDYYYPKIVLHLKLRYPQAEIHDIAQEFFMKLLDINPNIHIKKPTSWVYAVCDNIAKRQYKKSAQNEQLADVSFISEMFCDAETEDRIISRQNIADMFNMLKSEESKRIVILHLVYGYSIKETAEIMHMSFHAVKKRCERSVKIMKKYITDVADKTKK